MLIVIDANVLLAAILRDGYTRRLILISNNNFIIPEHIFEETKEHLDELSKRTGISNESIWQTLQEVIKLAEITTIKKEEFQDKLKEAITITPDIDDAHYLALALKKDCPVWTNDKKLKEQKMVKIITTEELIKNIKNNHY